MEMEDKPFIVITHIIISKENIRDYLEVADQTVMAYKATEKDLLHQSIDQNSDHLESIKWSEVYLNEKAFVQHLDNPPLALYLANHYQLGEAIEMEIFGDIGKECEGELNKKNIKYKIFRTKLGFSRLRKDIT